MFFVGVDLVQWWSKGGEWCIKHQGRQMDGKEQQWGTMQGEGSKLTPQKMNEPAGFGTGLLRVMWLRQNFVRDKSPRFSLWCKVLTNLRIYSALRQGLLDSTH